jgi:hypothetical protein
VSALTPSARAGVILTGAYWAESSSDASGTYTYNSSLATQNGSAVRGAIPTNSSLNSDPNASDNNVVMYFRTDTDLAGAANAYNGVLLGNLSGNTGLTATFSLNNSALSAGQLLPASDVVGDTYPGQGGNNAALRLMFMGGFLPDGTPNEWWSDSAAAYVTSMGNGQDVTLTTVFDPALWSNYNGQIGNTDAGEFNAALDNVTRLGLSFGSGYFFSNGFGFDTGTGTTAYIQLDSISPTPSAVPEPSSFLLVGGAAVVLAALRKRALARR